MGNVLHHRRDAMANASSCSPALSEVAHGGEKVAVPMNHAVAPRWEPCRIAGSSRSASRRQKISEQRMEPIPQAHRIRALMNE